MLDPAPPLSPWPFGQDMGQRLRTLVDDYGLWRLLCLEEPRRRLGDCLDWRLSLEAKWAPKKTRERILLSRNGLRRSVGYLIREERIAAAVDDLTDVELEWLAWKEWPGYAGQQEFRNWLRERGETALAEAEARLEVELKRGAEGDRD